MGLALNENIFGEYFSFLTKLDDFTKKQLIITLTKSLNIEKKEEFDLKFLYGAWEDDRTSDEIIKDLRQSRVEKNFLIDL